MTLKPLYRIRNLASERSERDTYRGKNEKIGDVCLFVLYV